MRRPVPACVVLLLLAATGFAQEIPVGTVLPVMTNRSVDSRRSRPGDRISARLMQDVTLPSGERIRAGAKVDGRVVETTATSAKSGSRLIIRFDRLVFDKKEFPVTVSLRSLASTQDVFSAQLPTSNFDEYGTSISDWTTVQVGGAAVYLGDGTVRDAMDVVGRAPGYGTVTAKLLPAPEARLSRHSRRERARTVLVGVLPVGLRYLRLRRPENCSSRDHASGWDHRTDLIRPDPGSGRQRLALTGGGGPD